MKRGRESLLDKAWLRCCRWSTYFFALLSQRGLPECTSERGLVEQRGVEHAMVWGTKKTEHAGAKKETGAFYGRKADARRGSNYRRRQDGKSTINAELLSVIDESSAEVVSG